jgi:hypothetical protein
MVAIETARVSKRKRTKGGVELFLKAQVTVRVAPVLFTEFGVEVACIKVTCRYTDQPHPTLINHR